MNGERCSRTADSVVKESNNLIAGLEAAGIRVDRKNNIDLGVNGVPAGYAGAVCDASVIGFRVMPMNSFSKADVMS